MSPTQLGRACERFVSALGQCATPSVWPLLFTTLTDVQYGGQSIDAVCKCLVNVATGKSKGGEDIGDGGKRQERKGDDRMPTVDFDTNPDLPSSSSMFARLIVTSIYTTEKIVKEHFKVYSVNDFGLLDDRNQNQNSNPKKEKEEDEEIETEIPSSLLLLSTIGTSIHAVVGDSFNADLFKKTQSDSSGGAVTTSLHALPNVYQIFCNIGKIATTKDGSWWSNVVSKIQIAKESDASRIWKAL